MELGENRAWLLNSHLNGVAQREGADPHARIEALLILRDQLAATLRDVEHELRALAPVLSHPAPAPIG
ncbi:MAG: hypothetical protein IT303_13755 [Dehalococcoidia bacterium]|nr:hypothetical protein [Dehalococcoidia bacterium]